MCLSVVVPSGRSGGDQQRLTAAQRSVVTSLLQALDGGGGATTSISSASTAASGRHDGARIRKHRKKEEQLVTTDSVKDYRGHIQDVDTLISYIECGDRKPPASGGSDKSAISRRSERAGRREVKSRRAGGATGDDRRAGRRGGGKSSAVPARSASLETRPATDMIASSDHSSVCGDLAQSRPTPTPGNPPTVPTPAKPDIATDVGSPPANHNDGMGENSRRVAVEPPVQEEPEFLVVTRRQRRRLGSARTGGCETGARPNVWRRRMVPQLPCTVSNSAPHSDTAASDSDSEAGVRGTMSTTVHVQSSTVAPSGSFSSSSNVSVTSAVSSWADVAKPRSIKSSPDQNSCGYGATTSSDFCDRVGDNVVDGSTVRVSASREQMQEQSDFRSGTVEENGMIAGAHPDEFPAITPTKGNQQASPSAQKVNSPLSKTVPPRSLEQESLSCPAIANGSGAKCTSTKSKIHTEKHRSERSWKASRVIPSLDSRSPTRAPPSRANKLTNGEGPLLGDAARRIPGPAVVIPVDDGRVLRTKVQDLQFGYIDGVEKAGGQTEAELKPAVTSGVDGFCRRFRQQPLDVSQFNWREISVFLSKVYAEAAAVPGALFEEHHLVSFEASR